MSTSKNSGNPHRALSLKEKFDIIQEFERTQQKSHLPKLFNCHSGQIYRTLHHKIEIVSEWMRFLAEGKPKLRRKRAACKVLQAVGVVLNEWILRCQSYPIDLNDQFILDKAFEIAKVLNLTSFRGNLYWYKKFKTKYHLLEVDWQTWTNRTTVDSELVQKSLDIEQLVDELRKTRGEKIIPLPSKMDEKEYDRIINALADSQTPTKNNDHASISSNNSNGPYMIVDSDEEYELLSIENSSICNTETIIETYQDALNHFRYLELFIISMKNSKLITIIDQIGKVLLNELAKESGNQDPTKSNPSIYEGEIDGYQEAINHLVPLEQFVLLKENLRAVGLLNQLENRLREEL